MPSVGDIVGRHLTVLVISATLPLALSDRSLAASYFCSTDPIKLDSYRPDDADQELEIKVNLDLAPFWFDDQSGDYQSYEAGIAGQLERAKLRVPVDLKSERGSLEYMVAALLEVGRCSPSRMGAAPSPGKAKP